MGDEPTVPQGRRRAVCRMQGEGPEMVGADGLEPPTLSV